MYELHHLKGNTYYIDGPTNCGLYLLGNHEVALIDCGTKEDTIEIDKVLKQNHFIVKYLIMTHSHPDHSGGSIYLSQIYHCKLIASKIERAFFRDSKLDLGLLNGGYPLDEFDTKLMHIDDQKEIYSLEEIPKGLRSFKLKGHHYGMIGIKTNDDVYFIADTLGSINLVLSQHILLMYDVKGYLKSLEYVKSLKGNIIVPSHSSVSTNIDETVDYNKNKIEEIIKVLLNYLKEWKTTEDTVSYIFNYYKFKMTYNRYLLVTSTIRSYLSYLSNESYLEKKFENYKLYFKKNGRRLEF